VWVAAAEGKGVTKTLAAKLDALALTVARKVCSGYLTEADRVKVLKAAFTRVVKLAQAK